MSEKKIFSINLNCERLIKEYYMDQQTEKQKYEILMSVDNNMEIVYGLILYIYRDENELPDACYSIFQAKCSDTINFKDTNNIEDIEYHDVVELAKFNRSIELEFLKKYFSNTLTMNFNHGDIRDEILNLNSSF